MLRQRLLFDTSRAGELLDGVRQRAVRVHLVPASGHVAGQHVPGTARVGRRASPADGALLLELTRVFRELGLDASVARKTPPRTMKRSPESLSRVFANHKDLARALKRWAPKGCRLEGMILDTKGTRPFRCNAARACDHFKELERACRGGGEC